MCPASPKTDQASIHIRLFAVTLLHIDLEEKYTTSEGSYRGNKVFAGKEYSGSEEQECTYNEWEYVFH